MSSPPTLDASNEQAQSPISGRHRFSHLAAYLAAPLWALQAVIWLAAPKVQEAAAPFAITKPLLFVLFWLSIAGAVAFSAASAADIPRVVQGLGSPDVEVGEGPRNNRVVPRHRRVARHRRRGRSQRPGGGPRPHDEPAERRSADAGCQCQPVGLPQLAGQPRSTVDEHPRHRSRCGHHRHDRSHPGQRVPHDDRPVRGRGSGGPQRHRLVPLGESGWPSADAARNPGTHEAWVGERRPPRPTTQRGMCRAGRRQYLNPFRVRDHLAF